MSALLDPTGFVADCIAIANALGIYSPAQQQQTQRLLDAIGEAHTSIKNLSIEFAVQSKDIKTMIATSSIIEVRSRLQNVSSVPPEQLELLLKLLFYIKQIAPNIVFAIVVKYSIGRTVATLGFAGSTTDAIEDLAQKVNHFCGGISHVFKEMTTYVNVRIRGKSDVQFENACAAALTAVATEVCGLSRNVELLSARNCSLEAKGSKTVVLLQPAEVEEEPILDCDMLQRTFLVGDTRSGKSTLGNALLRKDLFTVSKGMTGTMQIIRGERIEQVGDHLWLNEIYDTPGLNDKDGLDVLYVTAIEDHIRMLQRASTLIMTISVDAGITHGVSRSVAAYKKLFGESMASMLIVVLTINHSADAEELQEYLELNWPTVFAIDNRIKRTNVFCLSLYDLRGHEETESHRVIGNIENVSRGMPLKLIEALEKRYRSLRESLAQKSCDFEKEMQTIMNDGWQAFEHLTERYENSPYVKLTDTDDGSMDGFVMKGTDFSKKMVSTDSVIPDIISLGITSAVRKIAIHAVRKVAIRVRCHDRSAWQMWQNFLKLHSVNRHNHDLMRLFGDMLYENGLGVAVHELSIIYIGTLRVRRYKLRVFDPVNRTQEELRLQLQQLLKESREDEEEELRPELIHDLANSIIPSAVRHSYGRRTKKKKKNAK